MSWRFFFQKRHRVELEGKIETDLTVHFNGSPLKLVKCLELLQIIVTSNKLAISIDKSTVQSLALQLYSLCSQEDLSEKSLTCLLEIFKRNHELALPASTSLFIEINCNLDVKSTWPQFVAFLNYWLKIVKLLKVKRPVLHFGVLLNYINRVPFLPEVEVSS